jgi:kinetochore protein Spc7/SPC105
MDLSSAFILLHGCVDEIVDFPSRGERLYNAVSGRLAEASPEDNHACLLDACIVVMEVYQ